MNYPIKRFPKFWKFRKVARKSLCRAQSLILSSQWKFMRKDKNNRMTDAEVEALVGKLSPKDARLDQNFKQDLNYRLHSEISRLGGEKQNKPTINFNFMNKFKYVLSATGAVAIEIGRAHV